MRDCGKVGLAGRHYGRDVAVHESETGGSKKMVRTFSFLLRWKILGSFAGGFSHKGNYDFNPDTGKGRDLVQT